MNQKVAAFIYILARDHLPVGIIERIMQEHVAVAAGGAVYSSTTLANYAQDVAQRLENAP